MMSSQAETKADPPQDQVINDFLNVMKEGDSEEVLEKAFKILCKDKDKNNASVSADVLRRAMENGGVFLTEDEVEETIRQVKAEKKDRQVKAKADKKDEEQLINNEEFKKMIKLLKEPTVVDQLKKIYELVCREDTKEVENKKEDTKEVKDTKKVVLYGESGVGKTWMAKKVADRAVRQGIFDIALWIYPNRDPQESIAYQLSIQSALDDWKAKEDEKEKSEKDKAKEQQSEEVKEKKKREELERMIRKALKGKRVLLVFDGEGGPKEGDLLAEDSDFYKLLPKDPPKPYKFLCTRRSAANPDQKGNYGIKVRPLTRDDAIFLVVGKDGSREMRELADFFIGQTKRLPSEVLIIAKTVSYLGRSELIRQQNSSSAIEPSFKNKSSVIDALINAYDLLPRSVLIDCYSSETSEKHFLNQRKIVNYNELISYWIMEGHLGQFDRIEDAYKEGHRVLMDLLDCGLLKNLEAGYVMSSGAKFDIFDIHEKYKFFREIRLGLATTFDNKLGNVAWADGMIRTVSSGHDRGKQSTLPLNGNRFGEVPDNFKQSTLLLNGNRFGELPDNFKLSTLLLDGNHFGEVPDSFLKSHSELEILAIFDPTHKPFPLPMLEMQNLRLLILRGCEFLNRIEGIFQWEVPENPQVHEKSQPQTSNLQHSQSSPLRQTSGPGPSNSPRPEAPTICLKLLTVLEISGSGPGPSPHPCPCPLKIIPEHVFERMPDLKSLNLSFVQIESLPASFYRLTKLEILILRGCSSLKELKSLKNFKNLEVLDLSGSTSVENLHDKSFSENHELQILNLSKTKIEKLPLVRHLANLKHLSLRDCLALQRIRKIVSLKSLQVFDISGSTKIEEFLDPSLRDLTDCKVLDASRTSIKRLPFNVGNLRHLYLKECSQLRELTPFEAVTKVEVLDLSGSSKLEDIKDGFFATVEHLTELNLSKTGVKNLPSLSSLGKLRRLLLSHCLSLEKLEQLSSLHELEVLDLSGSNLVDIKDAFLGSVEHLRELNLSETGVKNLPSLSSLGNLRRLLLSHCLHLEELEQLSSLHELEVLDLSGCWGLKRMEENSFANMKQLHTLNLSETRLDLLPSLQNLTKLKELYVRDCPRLTDLPGLEKLPVLEILDHSGTTLKSPPSFNHPNCRLCVIGPYSLSLENFVPQQLLKDPGCNEQPNIDDGGDKLDPCRWRISSWQPEANVNVSEENLGVPVNGFHFIQLLKRYPSLLSNKFSRFHFCVSPAEAQTNLPDKVSYKDELSLRDIYFGQVPLPKPDRCLEIRGFNDCPPLPEHLLEQAEFVVLIDNSFLSFLSDLNVDSITTMKACWIDRCNEMEHVFGNNAADNVKNLEILWVFDAMKLSSISSQDTQDISFKSLRSLYLEYCPQLSAICSSFLQLEGLEILHIRYCQNLETLFQDESARLDKLNTLTLWGLPELKKIACKLESLCRLRVGQCPLLEHVLSSTQGEEREFEAHWKLGILQIKFCDKLKSIFASQHDDVVLDLPKLRKVELWALPELQKIAFRAPSLQILKVGECPSLENVVDFQGVNEKLEVLEVSSCDKVKTIIKGSGLTLGKLDKMELMSLPELESIGADHFPHLEEKNCMIYGCPKLQKPILGEPRTAAPAIPESNDARNPGTEKPRTSRCFS